MTTPKYWRNRAGEKIKIAKMSEQHIDNVVRDLRFIIDNQQVSRTIASYGRMFNKGKSWMRKTTARWCKSRLKAMKLEKANRIGAFTHPQ